MLSSDTHALHTFQRAMVLPGGKIEARPMMYIALTYDHRLIDGREVSGHTLVWGGGMEMPWGGGRGIPQGRSSHAAPDCKLQRQLFTLWPS